MPRLSGYLTNIGTKIKQDARSVRKAVKKAGKIPIVRDTIAREKARARKAGRGNFTPRVKSYGNNPGSFTDF